MPIQHVKSTSMIEHITPGHKTACQSIVQIDPQMIETVISQILLDLTLLSHIIYVTQCSFLSLYLNLT